ncbi:uncharacterized protein METZ01_LOCUS8668 [marine metagenome]|uniref:Uncharacterized protein n=1 Tax=marine metagenome TaxID=408172 RepID=A0A381NNW1_9ZZZZ
MFESDTESQDRAMLIDRTNNLCLVFSGWRSMVTHPVSRHIIH